ncbi:unnamed protein product [Paramecium octaurelia]|uniref:Uncharacterized protein n=1 Tax=Paramecium octaurelia TaxID=43137 RepID=A0A8S1TZ28_PAROT|nr:unnamed protein product [Paramecium octaurelia]
MLRCPYSRLILRNEMNNFQQFIINPIYRGRILKQMYPNQITHNENPPQLLQNTRLNGKNQLIQNNGDSIRQVLMEQQGWAGLINQLYLIDFNITIVKNILLIYYRDRIYILQKLKFRLQFLFESFIIKARHNFKFW